MTFQEARLIRDGRAVVLLAQVLAVHEAAAVFIEGGQVDAVDALLVGAVLTADDPVMSKIHPEFAWVAGGDYKDKLTTAMIGQEDFDLMFCGGWHGLSTFIQDGNFADLSAFRIHAPCTQAWQRISGRLMMRP